ncbi:phosphoenolpyruvate synthase [Chryseobacterium gotjawalense]|uniref:Phosphoenolpyruvate synthase n=1 Tax=Chryseobacterium gotjawalense TaxID=3042315 RepID=A0ABY8RBT3_9FLAO|nr:phosphoenolpyruvate synthase [Chryseobacterium sp. wdc7]WHF51316.1 phosphoenolpyruvate synthase [Chryseobacterium sp. wdc7]
MNAYTIPFNKIDLSDLPQVGGKNASLGEMFNKLSPLGIEVPDGFAVTVESYRSFLSQNQLQETLKELLDTIDCESLSNLPKVASQCRTLITNAHMPKEVKTEIINAYRLLAADKNNLSVAVRSSATAEDLPTASFAGQHDSFLNVRGEENLLNAVQQCYVSLFNDRAIKYRIDNGFDHMQVGLSVGVQYMVRSDEGCAGVIFTIDPESGFENAIYITGAWGLGENVVQGAVNPDEFWVFKHTLSQGKNGLISRKKGEKTHMMVYDETGESGRPIKTVETPLDKCSAWILSDPEVLQLAKWSYEIEKHYGVPMDIEWGKDGVSNKIYILQARPETVHSQKTHGKVYTYKLKEKGKVICRGKAVGKKIISGRACIIHSLSEAHKLQQGDILVADITNPDWNSLLRKAVSIVTNKGGRTSHASIVARELGIAAIVGTGNATQVIKDGQIITVANTEGDEGHVLEGNIPFEMVTTDLSKVPKTETTPLFILADPDRAFELSHYPAKGVGLLRMEFIINNSILIHPMALVQFDQLPEGPVKNTIAQMTTDYNSKTEYFVQQLAESIAKVAAAFYPNQVILRMSDFKTNEYASLVGGQYYEPKEENPMIGFRGASRYYDQRYLPGFGLECEAVLKVRNEMGLTNVKVMIPFCRTIDEAKKVLQTMESFGLKRGENGLEVYVMVEIPSNVILADQFAQLFDGFSIGSNDLTQLTLGLDRDSDIVSHLFDENNEAVTILIAQAIAAAKKAGIKIGLCGQAPSDFPEFSQFLVEQGIDSISFTPDSLIKGIENISKAELKRRKPDNGLVKQQ